MNSAQFKDVSHMCLAGTMVASWFLTQEVVVFNSSCKITWWGEDDTARMKIDPHFY